MLVDVCPECGVVVTYYPNPTYLAHCDNCKWQGTQRELIIAVDVDELNRQKRLLEEKIEILISHGNTRPHVRNRKLLAFYETDTQIKSGCIIGVEDMSDLHDQRFNSKRKCKIIEAIHECEGNLPPEYWCESCRKKAKRIGLII